MTELDKSLTGRLKHLPDADRKALDTMIEAAVNKLLHTPVSRLKAGAGDKGGDDLVQALRHLFDLADVKTEPAIAPTAIAPTAVAPALAHGEGALNAPSPAAPQAEAPESMPSLARRSETAGR
jgi:hypothetical protein